MTLDEKPPTYGSIKATEPGMLVHTLIVLQDPNDPLGFVWTEVYADSDALIFHLKQSSITGLLRVSPLLDSFISRLGGLFHWACSRKLARRNDRVYDRNTLTLHFRR